MPNWVAGTDEDDAVGEGDGVGLTVAVEVEVEVEVVVEVVVVELVGDIVTRLDDRRVVVVPPVDKIVSAAKAAPTVNVVIIAKSATDF